MAANQYYRRTLPSSCIALTSEEGKQVFKEAMNNGDMNSFFSLASQFRTQEEPAYCGLSTLVMVLNALSVDPGRVWKGPWRWYHENMLDCCIPLSSAAKQGITLFQFSCLAKCNGLDVDMVQARESASIGEFRKTIERLSRCDDQVLVCSYSRAVLDQTGDGHFSPLGGYHADRDLVLIFDVARFKYPPHWVPAQLLWKAMQALDQETGLPRGYMVLKATWHTGSPTVLFTIASNFNLTSSSEQKPELVEFLKHWHAWLATSFDEIYEKDTFYQILVTKFLSLWSTQSFPDCHQLFTMKIDAKCCGQLSEQHEVAIHELVDSLEKQRLFQIVEESLRSGEYAVSSCWDNLVSAPPTNNQLCCPWKINNEEALSFKFPDMNLAHLVTMVLLSWPYKNSHTLEVSEASSFVTHSAVSAQYIDHDISGATQSLQSEVELLKAQLSTIFSYYHTMGSSF